MGLKNSRTSIHEQSYYGHGKLLLTGEYFVLDGAKALAAPTVFGQSLRVTTLHSSESILYWVALNSKNKIWLSLVFETENFSCLNAQSDEAKRLSAILKFARKLNPDFLADNKDRAVETHLEFPNEWGLGTSSTLIYCIAQWAKVDGYELLKNTLGGSGYDVACAGNNGPLLYQLVSGRPEVTPVQWHPPFIGNIYFAYTGRKQLSSQAIDGYKTITGDKSAAISEINEITETILKCTQLDEFELLIREHERIVASELKQVKVGDTIFADYPGTVKSLGAWGGDFVMMTHSGNESELKDYLTQKSISIAFNWKDLILDNGSNESFAEGHRIKAKTD